MISRDESGGRWGKEEGQGEAGREEKTATAARRATDLAEDLAVLAAVKVDRDKENLLLLVGVRAVVRVGEHLELRAGHPGKRGDWCLCGLCELCVCSVC